MTRSAASGFEITPEVAREVVIALTEMRGWVMAGGSKEREFLGSRIDRCLAAFSVDGIVRDIHHRVIEGVERG